VLGAGAEARVRPPAPALSRPVVARMAPPPAPVSFAKQQEIVRENGGRPPAISQIRLAQPENAQVARPNIKMAPPIRQAPAQNAPTTRADVQQNNSNRPNQAPAQNAPTPRSDMQPGNSNRPGPANNSNSPNQAGRPGNAPVNPRAYNDRPPSSRPGDAGNVSPQLEQRQQQHEEKQQRQLQQVEQKHDQQQEKLEQRQHQERQKQEKPAKQDKPSKSEKPDKPHH